MQNATRLENVKRFAIGLGLLLCGVCKSQFKKVVKDKDEHAVTSNNAKTLACILGQHFFRST